MTAPLPNPWAGGFGVRLKIAFGNRRLQSLLARIHNVTTAGKRRSALKKICRSASKVYQRAVKPYAPRRTGALRASLAVIAVKKPRTWEVHLRVRPNPKHIRYRRENNLKRVQSLKESRVTDAAYSLLGRPGKGRRGRIIPAIYAHLTEGRNTTSHQWMRRSARMAESRALAAAIQTAKSELKKLL